MRLLQVIPLYDSYRVFLRELTNELLEAGHEVLTLCWTGEGNTIAFDKVDTSCRNFGIPRGSNLLKHLQAGKEMAAVVNDFKPDVVHAHFSAAILTAALARRRINSTRWLGTFQGLQFPHVKGLKGMLTRRAECFAAQRLDEAWVLTADDVEALKSAAPRANVKMQKSPGFGCADRFLDTPLPTVDERFALRVRAGFGPDDIVFIFIGRLVDFKGFHLAARAFMKAHRTRANIRWLVVGELDSLHPTSLEKDEWDAFCSHEAITWLRTQGDVLPWLDISDAMLFPTTREGMPVSVMEALARRVPVLTNRVRGCRDLVREGENGLFFKEANETEILNSIISFEIPPKPEAAPLIGRSNWIREMMTVYSLSA